MILIMLLGSLFPSGYMPVNRGGQITVTLCSAYADRTITIDLDGDEAPASHSGSSNCQGVFAGLALAPTSTPLPVPVPEWAAAPQRPLPQATVARHFHFDPNAPPQAPPVSTI